MMMMMMMMMMISFLISSISSKIFFLCDECPDSLLYAIPHIGDELTSFSYHHSRDLKSHFDYHHHNYNCCYFIPSSSFTNLPSK